MSRPYERTEERQFDDWFYSLSRAEQQRWRDKGIIPYREMKSNDHVFSIIPNHPAWTDNGERQDAVQVDRFISEDELRSRLVNLFRILDRFADGRMRLHLLFIRTMLGEQTGTNVTRLCRDFGMTKQAAAYRARMLRKALGSLATGTLVWKIAGTVKLRPKKKGKKPAIVADPRRKESLKRGGIHRAARHPGKFKRAKTPYFTR